MHHILCECPFISRDFYISRTTSIFSSVHMLTFFCASFVPFFSLSAPPLFRQFSSPKSPLSETSRLVCFVDERQRCWVLRAGVWRGVAPPKQRNFLSEWRATLESGFRVSKEGGYSGPRFDTYSQGVPIFHLILGGSSEFLLRKPGLP